MSATASTDLRLTSARRTSIRSAVRRQLGPAAAQWIAGVGNLAFAVVAARTLGPAGFGDLSAFLGAYVLLHLPAAGFGAGAALAPGEQSRRRRALALGGVVVGVLLAASTPWSASTFAVPPAVVVSLAVAAPGAALLGLERGYLFGVQDRRRVAASLLAEPATRLGVGLVAATVLGATGAAVAVTAAGYVALLTARAGGVTRRAPVGVDTGRRAATAATTATFVLFAVLQQQDLLVAKATLGEHTGGLFGALSTVGGAVAFASATVPLAILPQAGRDRQTDRVALALTVAIGAVATVVAAIAAGPLLVALFGEEYRSIDGLLAPYVAAMGLLGVARVLAARRFATGDGNGVATAVAVAASTHLVALAALGGSLTGVVTATATAMATATALLLVRPRTATEHLVDLARRAWSSLRSWTSGSDVAVLGALTTLAVLVRLVATRGLWVDEAITVAQARLPVGEMLDQLASTDVHPPLHHLLVWLTVRAAGTGELAVRAPSIVAGALLVPAVYGLAKVLYERRTALVAAAFASVAPFAVWYSQEARMYSLFMLLAVLSLWAQVAALKGDGKWAWAAYAVTTAAMAWTQWFAVVPIAAQQLVFAGVAFRRRHDRTRRRRLLLVWATALGACLVMVLPLLPLALDQLGAYTGRRAAQAGALSTTAPAQAGAGASGLAGTVSVYSIGANAIWAVAGYHSDAVMTQLAALWPLLLLAGLGALGRGRSRATTALALCIVAPTVAFVVAGTVKRDLFELRYFAAVVPFALVFLARTVTAVFHRHRAQVTAAVAGSLLLVVGLVDQQLNGANPRRYDFEGALSHVEDRAGDGDVILYEPDYLADVVDYYAPGLEARPLGDWEQVDDSTTVWLVATTRVADEEQTSARVGRALYELEESGRDVAGRRSVPNVRVWELSP